MTATDAVGASDARTWRVIVTGPLNTAQTQAGRWDGFVGSTMAPFTPVTHSGGVPPVTYAINPSLLGGVTVSFRRCDTGLAEL